MRIKKRKWGRKLTVTEKIVLKRSRKDIRLSRIELLWSLRHKERLELALQERNTGPFVCCGQVIVLPLEKQLANWGNKVLKEPNLIEELD